MMSLRIAAFRLLTCLLALLLTVAAPTVRAESPLPEGMPKHVSIIQLIADPQRFDGQSVRVIGFLRLEFEGNAVYLHREDYEKAILQNGISIDLTDAQLQSSAELNNGYVLIEGMFSASEKGHMGIWPGSLQRVRRLSNWSVDWSRRTRPKRR